MKKKHIRELRRITDSIPKELSSKLMRKEYASPTIREIAMRAVKDPKVSKRDKERYQAMIDSGYLDKMVEVIDHKIEKQISDYLETEIEKAKKLGRLPKVAPKLKLKDALRKSKKHVKKQNTQAGGTGDNNR